jgi:hypothetical protein
MWLLPWEKWLPAWLVGPLLVVSAVCGLFLDRQLRWWEYIALPVAGLLGAWTTYAWLKDGRHIFREAYGSVESDKTERP